MSVQATNITRDMYFCLLAIKTIIKTIIILLLQKYFHTVYKYARKQILTRTNLKGFGITKHFSELIMQNSLTSVKL